MSNIALILAGGAGTRLGNDIPKQFLPLLGKPVIMYSILAFQNHPMIDAIYIVCKESWISQLSILKESSYNLTKLRDIVSGGETRRQSSFKGIERISHDFSQSDIVLIHDAARPLVTEKVIADNIAAAQQFGACTTALCVNDTILMSSDGLYIDSIPPRHTMLAAQTPQSFKLGLIYDAHTSFSDVDESAITDDTALLVHKHIPVAIVKGDRRNMKLTTQEDFEQIKSLLQADKQMPL